MADKRAQVYFYQNTNRQTAMTRFGIQLVVDGKVKSLSSFMRTGSLSLDRTRSQDYGRAIGEELKEKELESYDLILDKRHDSIPCDLPSNSDTNYLAEKLKEGIQKGLTEKVSNR